MYIQISNAKYYDYGYERKEKLTGEETLEIIHTLFEKTQDGHMLESGKPGLKRIVQGELRVTGKQITIVNSANKKMSISKFINHIIHDSNATSTQLSKNVFEIKTPNVGDYEQPEFTLEIRE